MAEGWLLLLLHECHSMKRSSGREILLGVLEFAAGACGKSW